MRNRIAAIVVFLLVIGAAPSPSVSTRYYSLDPGQIDLAVLLPPPPDPASAEQRSDEEQVAQAVAARSPAEVFEAQEAAKRSVFFLVRSVGPGFTAARLPLTAHFFSCVSSDVKNLIDDAKARWDRLRPSGVPKGRGSYPSGHAAFAASTAIVLAQLIPSKRDAIFTQARAFAEDRILLGRHYPSDVAAGWTAGTIAAYVMMRDAAYQRDYGAVSAELRRAAL
jgi:acid phosphatase (class A)